MSNLTQRFFYANPDDTPATASSEQFARSFPVSNLIAMYLAEDVNSLVLSFEDSGTGDHLKVNISLLANKGKESMEEVVRAINSGQSTMILGDQQTKESIISHVNWSGTAVTISQGTPGTFALDGALTVAGAAAFTGRIIETLAVVNIDAQNGTLLAATVLSGILQHTSATGGGTLTTDTAANYISGLGLTADNMSVKCYYINDGDQTVTIAAGAGVTLQDAGQTIAENESAILLVRRTNATNVKVYILGA